jgi:hypothetical protein
MPTFSGHVAAAVCVIPNGVEESRILILRLSQSLLATCRTPSLVSSCAITF